MTDRNPPPHRPLEVEVHAEGDDEGHLADRLESLADDLRTGARGDEGVSSNGFSFKITRRADGLTGEAYADALTEWAMS